MIRNSVKINDWDVQSQESMSICSEYGDTDVNSLIDDKSDEDYKLAVKIQLKEILELHMHELEENIDQRLDKLNWYFEIIGRKYPELLEELISIENIDEEFEKGFNEQSPAVRAVVLLCLRKNKTLNRLDADLTKLNRLDIIIKSFSHIEKNCKRICDDCIEQFGLTREIERSDDSNAVLPENQLDLLESHSSNDEFNATSRLTDEFEELGMETPKTDAQYHHKNTLTKINAYTMDQKGKKPASDPPKETRNGDNYEDELSKEELDLLLAHHLEFNNITVTTSCDTTDQKGGKPASEPPKETRNGDLYEEELSKKGLDFLLAHQLQLNENAVTTSTDKKESKKEDSEKSSLGNIFQPMFNLFAAAGASFAPAVDNTATSIVDAALKMFT